MSPPDRSGGDVLRHIGLFGTFITLRAWDATLHFCGRHTQAWLSSSTLETRDDGASSTSATREMGTDGSRSAA